MSVKVDSTDAKEGAETNDFEFRNHGSVWILVPFSPNAEEWLEENISDEALTFGPGIVVEHRFVPPIVDGIQADGLSVVIR